MNAKTRIVGCALTAALVSAVASFWLGYGIGRVRGWDDGSLAAGVYVMTRERGETMPAADTLELGEPHEWATRVRALAIGAAAPALLLVLVLVGAAASSVPLQREERERCGSK